MTRPLSDAELAEVAATWTAQCGPCDYGLSYPCACPTGDPRPVVSKLLGEIERLKAAEALVAARVLRNVSEQIIHRVGELRENFRSGAVGIEYINGMEDADSWIERAIAHHELSAEEANR